MDPLAAIGLVTSAVEVAMKVYPVIVQGVENLKPFAVALYEKYTGEPITPEQRNELEAKIDDLHLQFQQPIPPEEDQ